MMRVPDWILKIILRVIKPIFFVGRDRENMGSFKNLVLI